MDKQNISADTLANYFDKPEQLEQNEPELYDALIDVFVEHYIAPDETQLYQCHGCKNLTKIKRGDNVCEHCNTGIYWGTV